MKESCMNKLRKTIGTVHYYIENTTNPVPLANGETATDVIITDYPGLSYETAEWPAEEIDTRYELIETPANAEGTYGYDDFEVNYYYRRKKANYEITKIEISFDGN